MMSFRLICILASLLFPLYLQSETIRWSADTSSGIPNVYRDKRSGDLVGMEKDIADAIAKGLGRTPEFIEVEWGGIIPGVKRGATDMAINTFVISPEREQEVDFSIPYYITGFQLVVHADEAEIKSFSDLREGHVVGTLHGCDTVSHLEQHSDATVRHYIEETQFFQDLANKRIHAAIIDAPIAKYYAAVNANLKLAGDPVGRVAYGAVIKQGSDTLTSQVNRAIESLKQSGELRKIIDRWDLWNPHMAEYTNDFGPARAEPVAFNQFVLDYSDDSAESGLAFYLSLLPRLGQGALRTMEISILSMLLAISLGLGLALARVYGPRPLSLLAKVYIELVRGTPLLIQLYFIFYGLPSVGVDFEPFTAGVLALGLNYAAYEAENYRAGLMAVPFSQMEAARALGMSHFQSLRHVIVPQAFKVMLPPVTNDFISLLKDSSLVSIITIVDLTFAYGLLANTYFNFFGIGILVAIIYLLLGLPFVFLARWAEKQLRVEGRRRAKA